MLVTSDNDVVGVVQVLRRVLESADYAAWLKILDVTFTDFQFLGLSRDASDRVVWQTCQQAGVVLITGNRSGGPGSLDQVIRQLSNETSLPVLTISDPQRVVRDSAYALGVARKLIDFLERIESLRGTGRLFLP